MTTAVLPKAYQALNLNVDSSLTTALPQGKLSNRKIIPIPFYLLIGTAVIGLACTIALAVMAMWVVMAVFAVFTLIQIAAAVSVYRNATTKELNQIVDQLSNKVAAFYKLNQDTGTQVDQIKATNVSLNQNVANYKKINEDLKREIDGLNEDLNGHVAELTRVKDEVVAFAKKYTEDKELLRKHLDEITLFLKGNEEDVSGLEKMRTEIHKLDITRVQFNEIETYLFKQGEENKHMYKEIKIILEIVKKSSQEYDDDILRLKDQNAALSLEVDKITTLYKKIESDLGKQQEILKRRDEQVKRLEELNEAFKSEISP